MPNDRRPKRACVKSPIETAAEYERALEVLEVLQKAPLGTTETEGLQDLVEAILDYEAKQNGVDGKGCLN
jgi:hypothetical protein